MQELTVEVKPDFIERQTKAQPIHALAELLWNALDADATRVDVDFDSDNVGGMAKIIVTDNGNGIRHAEAPQLFRNLGGSWKRKSVRTPGLNRVLHGQEGRGRFKAFALGGVTDWKVVYDRDGTLSRYDITVLEREIERVRITDEQPAPTAAKGVTVVISELKRQFTSLKPENAVQELSEIFAIYLKDYRDVSITIGGEKIDPNLAIANAWEFELTPILDEQGKQHSVVLEVIEWRRQTRRTLYLCGEQGFPLSQVETRFHVGDFHFSAYLKSSFIRELHHDGRLDLAEMVPDLMVALDDARSRIKELFRSRAAERARIVVDQWKEKNIYPYEGEAATPLETAERQIFDIVAITVQDASPDFRETAPKQAALHLRLLRHAIERSPTELQRILDEVLKLPKRKQKELANLLDETDLSGIISAATLVADRLKFLEALRFILFDYDARQKLRERSQLHKILEQNTWIFGEEYNLWASDKDLTTVLKSHKEKLDPDLVIDDPVKVINKARGIVDLMLSRAQRRHRHNDLEHLVIELKAPKVVINASHLMQIEGYALAVEEDPRFNRVDGLRWHFWIISDEYNKEVQARIRNGPDPQRRLIQKGERVMVGVKTWGEVLEENNARLQFVKEKLEHRVDDGQALAYLQERHREFLEGILIQENSEDETSGIAGKEQATAEVGGN
jgi:DNA mismatch repair enzyme (predicted ATPase)